MTLEQRAQQFWSVLVYAAIEQKVISHAMLSQITGFPKSAGNVLYYIYCYCKHNHLPPLNDIVMDRVTGHPDLQFPGDLRDFSAQQSRVFLYDWLNDPAPSEGMFREALELEEQEVERANAEYVCIPC
jgi:hypothetical protein